MCLTAEALALFLNILASSAITSEPGRITIHAETRDAHWVEVGEHWCTKAPQIDQMERRAALQNQ